MAKILVAASPEPRAILERILAGHELHRAESMTRAEELLRAGSYDGIVCTVVFDESRLFDLLRLAKADPTWRRIPFVCARVRRNVLDVPLALEGVALACQTLGAEAFLDIADCADDPEREMRAAIERHLVPRSRRGSPSD